MNNGPHIVPSQGTVTLKIVDDRAGRRHVHVCQYIDGWGPFLVRSYDRPLLTWQYLRRHGGLLALGVIAWVGSIMVMGQTTHTKLDWARDHGGWLRYGVAILLGAGASLLIALAAAALVALQFLWRARRDGRQGETPPRAPGFSRLAPDQDDDKGAAPPVS